MPRTTCPRVNTSATRDNTRHVPNKPLKLYRAHQLKNYYIYEVYRKARRMRHPPFWVTPMDACRNTLGHDFFVVAWQRPVTLHPLHRLFKFNCPILNANVFSFDVLDRFLPPTPVCRRTPCFRPRIFVCAVHVTASFNR